MEPEHPKTFFNLSWTQQKVANHKYSQVQFLIDCSMQKRFWWILQAIKTAWSWGRPQNEASLHCHRKFMCVSNHTGIVPGKNSSLCKPEMKDLMDALYHTVADKWEHIGIYLHLHMATLKAISDKQQHDPHKCLLEMLGAWLKRLHPPATWSAIIEAVEFLGEEQLGGQLREQYQL